MTINNFSLNFFKNIFTTYSELYQKNTLSNRSYFEKCNNTSLNMFYSFSNTINCKCLLCNVLFLFNVFDNVFKLQKT